MISVQWWLSTTGIFSGSLRYRAIFIPLEIELFSNENNNFDKIRIGLTYILKKKHVEKIYQDFAFVIKKTFI